MKKRILSSLLIASTLGAFLIQMPEGMCVEKVPFKPRWVSIPKKGRFFKYRRKEFSSPLLFQNALYVGSDAGYFSKYDTDGDKVWRIKLSSPVNSTASAIQKPDQTLDQPVVFFGDDEGFLHAVDGKDGKEIWKSDLGSEIWSAAAVSSDRLFAVSMEGKVFALSTDDGHMIWQKEYTLPPNASEFGELVIRGTADPVLDEGRLYVSFADGTFWALSSSDGKLLWEKKLGTQKGFNDVDGPVLIDQDRLYTASFQGNLTALSRKDGKSAWTKDIGSAVKMLMVAMDDEKVLFVSGTDSTLYALNPKTGDIRWKLLVGKGSLTSPIYYKGVVAVGLTSGTMNFIDAKTGKLIVRRFAKKGISSNPILDEDKIYFLSNGGRLYSLRFKIK